MRGFDADTAIAAVAALKRLDDSYAYAERVIPGCREMDWKALRELGAKGRRIDRLLAKISKKSVEIDYAETTHDLRVAVASAASTTFVPPHWRGSRRVMALVTGHKGPCRWQRSSERSGVTGAWLPGLWACKKCGRPPTPTERRGIEAAVC